jgi:hypothetical protein
MSSTMTKNGTSYVAHTNQAHLLLWYHFIVYITTRFQ